MPKFRWVGRSAGGSTVQGEIAARDKEDVLGRLKGGGITVTSVEEVRDGGVIDFVPPSDAASLPMPSAREKERPRPFLSLFAAAVFVAGAGAVGMLAPITSYDCVRDQSGLTTCTVTERILGVYPWTKQSLAGISSVSSETEYATYRRSSSVTPRRDVEYDLPERRLVLRASTGAAIFPRGWVLEDHRIGKSAGDIESSISAFLSESGAGRAGGWQANWRPLLISGILLLIAAGFVTLAVIGFSPAATKRLEERMAKIHADLAEKRRTRR